MDRLADPYLFVENLRYSLDSGESVFGAIKVYVQENSDSFTLLLEQWLIAIQNQNFKPGVFQQELPLFRKSIFDLLDLARQGVSIMDSLKLMEEELLKMCENDLDSHLDKLPFKLMIPMLGLQFPALMILLLGPLLIQFLQEVGS